MPKQDVIEVEAKVMEPLPNAMFRVELENGHKVLAYLSGKMKMNLIKDIAGRSSNCSAFAIRSYKRQNSV